MFLAAARIGEPLGWWHVDRLGIIASHFHLAALGFATFTAVGVGSRILPMFLGASGYPEWPLRWIRPVGILGMATFLVGRLGAGPALSAAGALLMAASVLLYLFLALGYFSRRAERQLDPALSHVALALVMLALALGAGVALLATPGFHPRGWAAYGLLVILGWLVLFIVGIYYRILPALTWMHLFAAGHGRTDLRTPVDLTRPPWAWWSLACLASGIVVMVAAVTFGATDAARSGAALFALGVAGVYAQVIRVMLLRLSSTPIWPTARRER
jgi:hypothetical protein